MSTPRAAPTAPTRRRALRRLLKIAASVLGAAFVGALGWMLALTSFRLGEIVQPRESHAAYVAASFAMSLARLSYDLPFSLRSATDMPGVCIVSMNEKAAQELGQNPKDWDRAMHARLLRRLTREGARAVIFDIVFVKPEPADDEFAKAIRENGRVILGGGLDIVRDFTGDHNGLQEIVYPPTPDLRAAAAGWGLLSFYPIDSDYGIRRIYTGTEMVPTAMWLAATRLGAPLGDTPEVRAEPRWMNYYGPPRSFPSIGYDRAVTEGDQPDGFFKDQIVIVGGGTALSELSMSKDVFRNPYSLFGDEFSDGVEVHLTTLLNFIRGDFLRRLDPRKELCLALAIGLLLGGLLPLLRPHIAVAAALLTIAAIVVAAVWGVEKRHVWFAWCIPAFVQAPLALTWAVGTRYFIEEKRRRALRDAFGHYLSPQMADRIADAEFDLAPGGEVVEATLLITDLEGFTPLSEELRNPELVLRVLTEYFTRTTTHILDGDGTIVNFVGDSVLAVWGAPLPDADHCRKAALAAWRLHESSHIEVDGHMLHTRVGLHTGSVLAGNVGSARRFDYTVIGDAVNFTSRLEGLNKHLGTSVLISDVLHRKLGGSFISRCVGEFRVVGKKESHVVHELLGPAETIGKPAWLDPFARGLLLILAGSATRLFDHLHSIPKTYETTVRWGTETDNGDLHGRIIHSGDASSLSIQQLDEALETFVGWHDQIPPATSAKRIDGERAYLKAHRGEIVIMPPSRVYLHEATWLSHDLPRESRLRLTARGGYYLRALARDLGKLVGCGAHLSDLHRTAIGPWADPGPANTIEIHGRDLLPWAPSRILSDQDVGDLRREETIALTGILPPDWAMPPNFPPHDAPIRGYHLGKLAFLLRPFEGRLKPLASFRGGI